MYRRHSVFTFVRILITLIVFMLSLESNQLFAEDFENGLPTKNWEYYGTPIVTHELIIFTSGSNSVLSMSSSGLNPTLNEAIYTVDLRDSTSATLQFAHEKIFNETDDLLPLSFSGHENGDGVALSIDGINWYTILNASTLSASNVHTINLLNQRNLIRANYHPDFEFTEHTKIKFQQYDEYVDPNSDDWLISARQWDDITVTATYADVLRVAVDNGYLEGTNSIAGSIEITNVRSADLTVHLSGDASLSLPEQVVVPAGKNLAEFSFSIFDDSDVQGQRSGTITASATNYSSVDREFNIYDDESPYAVTFDLNGKGSLVNGALLQYVPWGQAATEPKLQAYPGWHFDNWSVEYSRITQDLLVVAQYRPVYNVTFNLGTKGTLYKGELEQAVVEGNTAIPPTFTVEDGWSFVGWDTNYSNVRKSLLVTAQYEAEAMTGKLSTKLNASDKSYRDYFGQSVSLSGNSLLVGAYQEGDSGSCYVFNYENGEWTEVQKLTQEMIDTDAQFGFSVDLYGDFAVIGAPANSVEGVKSGCVYVYRRIAGVWSLEACLSVSDGAAGDRFGESVSIEANTLVVGAAKNDTSGYDSGCAYVFIREQNQWYMQAKLVGHDLTVDDRFGSSVDICGERIVVGAPGDYTNSVSSGSAYVFHRTNTTWTETSKLVGDNSIKNRLFGRSVSISGSLIAVGAPTTFSSSTGLGKVYIFEYQAGSWIRYEKLQGSDSEEDDFFGASVQLSAETLVVGAPLDDFHTNNKDGSIYLFKKDVDKWVEKQKLGAIPGEYLEGNRFGTSVALSGDLLAVGSPWEYNQQGAAFVFDLGVPPITINFDLDGKAMRMSGGDLQQVVRVSDAAIAPTLEVLEGWHFKGWDLDLTSLTASTTVKAQFLPIHNVSFDLGTYGTHVGGGSLIQQVIDGETALEPVLLVDDGWYFDGWTIDFSSVSEDLNISARYLPIHAVSFDLGEHGIRRSGGNLNQNIIDGQPAEVPFVDVDTGWHLYAWDADFSAVTADLAVKAVYIPTHTVTFDLGPHGELVSGELVQEVGDGCSAIAPQLSTAAGWSFVGWDVLFHDINTPITVTAQYHPSDSTANRTILREFSKVREQDFGDAVAMSNGFAVVGAPKDGKRGINSGSVFIYIRNADGTWSKELELFASDADEYDCFGDSVAISGDTLLVGATGVDDHGAVYVFRRRNGSWSEEAKIVPEDYKNRENGSFLFLQPYVGSKIAICEDTILVSDNYGVVYVFVRSGNSWVQQVEFSPRATLLGGYNSPSLSIDGDTMVVGYEDIDTVYIYERIDDSWGSPVEMTPSDVASPNDSFSFFLNSHYYGAAVILSGDRLAVGAPGDYVAASGAVYIYEKTEGVWTERCKLEPEDSRAYLFGRSLSFNGDWLAIGYLYDDEYTYRALSIYSPDGASWNEDLALIGEFDSLSLSGDYLLSGDGNYFRGGIAQLVDLGVPAASVSFDLQDKADRTGGGELSQLVALGEAAIAPELREHSGWVFDGWDASFDSISNEIEVNALYYDSTSLDGDALWDGWERRHFGSIDVSDGKIDTDGDGQTDESEFFSGNDPKDPSDYFKIIYFKRFSDGKLGLSFTSNDDIVDRRYRIVYTEDLSLGIWKPLPFRLFDPNRYGNFISTSFAPPGTADAYFFKVEAFIEE